MLKINQIADLLLENKQAQERIKEMLKPLQDSEEDLREQMLLQLKKNKMEQFRSEMSGFTYTRAFKPSLGIVEGKEAEALKWAVKNKCAKVDTVAANKLLKGAGALPEGFEQKETEYLSVNSPKKS